MSSITVRIHDLSRGGSGVAKLESGEIVFVPFTAPGDEVRIRIIQKQKNYSKGELIEIIRPSPLRVTPPCKVFGTCGGCDWQHLAYPTQFETKKTGLLHTLKRVGLNTNGTPIDEFPAEHFYHYRNRIQLHGNPTEKTLGFYEKGSLRIVPIDRCEIADERINRELPALKTRGESEQDREYKLEVEVNDQVQSAWNQKHAAFGFRQINDEQNLKLQQWIADHAGSEGRLLDLYGGHGNLSLQLAPRFSEIHCVDTGVPNERKADIPKHFQFHRKDVRRWLQEFKKPQPGKTTVILDPPREGMGHDFVEIEAALRQIFRPSRLLLVGCDVDAFAKDCSRFVKCGYRLDRLGVLDLFPQTPHVESLALFSL